MGDVSSLRHHQQYRHRSRPPTIRPPYFTNTSSLYLPNGSQQGLSNRVPIPLRAEFSRDTPCNDNDSSSSSSDDDDDAEPGVALLSPAKYLNEHLASLEGDVADYRRAYARTNTQQISSTQDLCYLVPVLPAPLFQPHRQIRRINNAEYRRMGMDVDMPPLAVLSAPQVNSRSGLMYPAQTDLQNSLQNPIPRRSSRRQQTDSRRQRFPPTPYAFIASDLERDPLAVCDPNGDYDLVDFLDDWRSIVRRREPTSDLCFENHSRAAQTVPNPHAAPEIQDPLDFQDIAWSEMGTSREDALAARIMLSPFQRPSKAVMNIPRYERSKGIQTSVAQCSVPALYNFRAFDARQRPQISHYQLRHLLATSSRSEIFYARGNKVVRTSLACPSVHDTVMDLGCRGSAISCSRVSCLAATSKASIAAPYRSDDILIAGGFGGEYGLLNLDTGTTREGIVAEAGEETQAAFTTGAGFSGGSVDAVITHVHTNHDRRSGLPQATLCSNDRRIRILDIRRNEFTASFHHEHAINCAATSPDSRLQARACDHRDVLIASAETGEHLVALRAHTDHVFACAWSPDGVHVATGAEDGLLALWDARNWARPLACEPSVMSCVRSLHFTPDGAALVAAEDDDVVSVYDMKPPFASTPSASSSTTLAPFRSTQRLRFFGAIAGVAVLDEGAEMAVSIADRTVGGLLTFRRARESMTSRSGDGTYFTRTRRKTGMFDDDDLIV